MTTSRYPTFSIDRIVDPVIRCEYVRVSVQTGNAIYFLDVPPPIAPQIAEAMKAAAAGGIGNHGLVTMEEGAR